MIGLVEEKIGLSKEQLRKGIGTYSLAAAYGLSETQVLSKNSFVQVDGLTTEQSTNNSGIVLQDVVVKSQGKVIMSMAYSLYGWTCSMS